VAGAYEMLAADYDWMFDDDALWQANRTQEKIQAEVTEILRPAAETDQREDALFGDARGDELLGALAIKASGLARLRRAKAQLEAEAVAREQAPIGSGWLPTPRRSCWAEPW